MAGSSREALKSLDLSTSESMDRKILIERIQARIDALRTTAKAVSLKAGLGATAVADILSGKTKKPSLDAIVAIADTLQCDLAYLVGIQENPRAEHIGKPVSPIPIIGVAEAGAFRQAIEFPVNGEHELSRLYAAKSELYPRSKHFALEVRGDSMNAAKPSPITEGMHVLCVDVIDAELTIESGKIYAVRRTQDGGQTYEWTVKRAHVFRDRIELRPESTNPVHAPFVIRREDEADESQEIVALGWVYAGFHSFER